jgi:hypothetical protein
MMKGPVIASEAKQSSRRVPQAPLRDCFVESLLAMTGGEHDA